MTDEAKALVEKLRDLQEPLHEWDYSAAADLIETQAREINRLRLVGGELGFYAGHDDSCACVKGWATGPCNCGYTDTWNQWCAALAGDSHDQ